MVVEVMAAELKVAALRTAEVRAWTKRRSASTATAALRAARRALLELQLRARGVAFPGRLAPAS
jgi:hypothetical protein